MTVTVTVMTSTDRTLKTLNSPLWLQYWRRSKLPNSNCSGKDDAFWPRSARWWLTLREWRKLEVNVRVSPTAAHRNLSLTSGLKQRSRTLIGCAPGSALVAALVLQQASRQPASIRLVVALADAGA